MSSESGSLRGSEGGRRTEEVKYDKLKSSFDSAPRVYVDRKLNVTGVSEQREAKGEKPTNYRI